MKEIVLENVLVRIKYPTHLFPLSSIGPVIMVYIEYYTVENKRAIKSEPLHFIVL